MPPHPLRCASVPTRPTRLALWALVMASGPAGAASPPAPACPAPQRTLFACSTGRHTVAVCGSAELSPHAGSVHYRFGRTGATPWTYPAADAPWRDLVHGGTLMFSGGGGAYLAFDRPPYRYVVYTAIGRGWGTRAGVVTFQHGRRLAHLPCRQRETAELGPVLFEQLGLADDPVGFELP